MCYLILLCLGLLVGARATNNISFIFITSFGQYGTNSSGVIPAVDMALAEINGNPSVLPGYRLMYDKAQDSQCLYAKSLESFFAEIQSNPVKMAVIGCGCSVATQPVAAISSFWNIPQIAYVDVSTALDDRSTYRKFFRTNPSDYVDYPAYYSIMNHFGWKRIRILTQNEDLFKLAELNIRGELEKVGFNVSSITFETKSDPVAFVHDLFRQEEDYHIMFLNCYPGQARKIICQAVKLGLQYPKYVWITNDWYNAEWWTAAQSNSVVNCTDAELAQFLDRALALHSLPTPEDNSEDASTGHNSQIFISNYSSQCKNLSYIPSEAAGRAYDAVWVLALALNSTLAMYSSSNINGTGCENVSGSLVPLEQFNYTNQKMACLLKWNIQQTNFSGITGNIQFNENGTRIQNRIVMKQYRLLKPGTLERVPFAFLNVQDDYHWYFLNNISDKDVYPDGTPSDGTPLKILQTFSISMIVVIGILSTCGIVLTIICFLFNLLFRNTRIVRLSSGNLNYAILLGALLMYSSVYVTLVPTTLDSIMKIMCMLKMWLFIVGYSLCFGTVLSKMWRVYKIFIKPSPKNVIKDYRLFIIVSITVGIGVCLLVLESAIPQLRSSVDREVNNENPSEISDDHIKVIYEVFVCHKTSTPSFYWNILIFSYLLLIQMIGIMLAFQTRRVKYPGLRDSKFIAAIIYISSLILIILATDMFILNTYLYSHGIIYSLGVISLTTTFLLLTFVPKMIQMYQNQEPESVPSGSINAGSELQSVRPSFNQDSKTGNLSLQEVIQEKEKAMAAVEKELIELKEINQSCLTPTNVNAV